MVKTTFTIASLVTILSLVNAQTATEGSATSTVAYTKPTDLSALYSSLIANPSALQSYLNQASAQVSLLPSAVRPSLYSQLAEASKSLEAAAAHYTSAKSSASTLPSSMTLVVCALTITGVLATLI